MESRTRGGVEWPRELAICCVQLPQLPLCIEVLRHPDWDGRPLVLAARPRKVVDLCSTEAEHAGILPGLPLREVLTLCSDAIIVQPDPVYLGEVTEGLAEGLQQVSPLVEYQPHQFFLGLRGLHGIYDNDLNEFERAIRAAVPSLLLPRLGMAANKFVASLAAVTAPAVGIAIVPAEQSAAFLAPFSVQYLPFTSREHKRVRLLGLKTVGDVARLPFPAMQSQFGPSGARCWRLAQGEDVDPLIPLQPRELVRASLRFDDPLSSLEAFHVALKTLLARALADPLLGKRGVRQVRLSAMLSGGASWEQLLVMKGSVAGRDALYRAVKDKLLMQNASPPAPFEKLTVELLHLGAEVGKQMSLFNQNTQQKRQIDEAARQLRVRYGHVPLYHIVEVEPWSRIPERRWALMPSEP